jgi:hypothetical protein
MRDMHYGKNGPWHKNIGVGLLLYAASLIPLAGTLLAHKDIGKPLQLTLLALVIIGTVIIAWSVLYNFRRMRHCVEISRGLDTLLDAGRIPLPEYTRNQTLLAAELQRLDSLTKP